MFKKTTLPNGLRIISVPQRQGTEAVTILVLVKTGSKYETKKTNGISHFLEHMLFKGTKKRPSPIVISETLDKIGGVYNAFTSQDYTGYFAKVIASHFDLALDWISDIFFNSIFPKKEVEKEKKVIIEEINMIFDNPMRYIYYLWLKLLYGDQPAGWLITGKKEVVSKMKREEILNYMKQQYVAKNTIVCVAGKIKEKEAIKKIKKYFSKIKKKAPSKKPEVIEKQEKPNLILEQRNTEQTHLYLGVRGYNLFHPQRYAFELLGTILGGMMSSRLFVKIREKMGIAYYINTIVEADPDTGFLVTRAGIANERVKEGISAILKEYKKISQKKVSEKELKKAKERFKGTMALELEGSDAKALFYGMQELLENRILTVKQIFKKIDDVTPNDIQRVARDIFRPERLNLALIGPFKDKKKFEKLLLL